MSARIYDKSGTWLMTMATKEDAWKMMDAAGYEGQYFASTNSGPRELFYDAHRRPGFFFSAQSCA